MLVPSLSCPGGCTSSFPQPIPYTYRYTSMPRSRRRGNALARPNGLSQPPTGAMHPSLADITEETEQVLLLSMAPAVWRCFPWRSPPPLAAFSRERWKCPCIVCACRRGGLAASCRCGTVLVHVVGIDYENGDGKTRDTRAQHHLMLSAF